MFGRKMMTVALAVSILAGSAAADGLARNVILMISDGQGFNGWEAAKLDQGSLPYDSYGEDGWEFFGCTHWMLNGDGSPQGYDPNQMWSDFNYVRGNDDYSAFTDSAAAATALYTGVKTYKGAISVDFNQNPVTTIAEISAFHGRATGAVSSVEFSHATPAAVDAHNVARGNYADIANEMIYNSDLDVIMGCGEGHSANKYVGGHDTWNDITDDGQVNGFQYIGDRADFDSLAAGTYNGGVLPSKVLGIAHTTYTLSDVDANHDGIADDPSNADVPTLATMTSGALNILAQDSDGFFLMVEGGAVDWENHAQGGNQMLLEQRDFDAAVQNVINWVETNSSWDETLVIITADHETGMIWGDGTWTDDPQGLTDAELAILGDDEYVSGSRADLEDRLANHGSLNYYDDGIDTFNDWQRVTDPNALQYGSYGHTNALVPLWAKGCGADGLSALAQGVDAQAATFWNGAFDPNWDGTYIDNTDVYSLVAGVTPEPASLSLIGLGALALLRRRRNG